MALSAPRRYQRYQGGGFVPTPESDTSAFPFVPRATLAAPRATFVGPPPPAPGQTPAVTTGPATVNLNQPLMASGWTVPGLNTKIDGALVTHYGYPGDKYWDATSGVKAMGDRENILQPLQSVALTVPQRQRLFGNTAVAGSKTFPNTSTGQSFQLGGNTYVDDDTAPEGGYRVDVFNPRYPGLDPGVSAQTATRRASQMLPDYAPAMYGRPQPVGPAVAMMGGYNAPRGYQGGGIVEDRKPSALGAALQTAGQYAGTRDVLTSENAPAYGLDPEKGFIARGTPIAPQGPTNAPPVTPQSAPPPGMATGLGTVAGAPIKEPAPKAKTPEDFGAIPDTGATTEKKKTPEDFGAVPDTATKPQPKTPEDFGAAIEKPPPQQQPSAQPPQQAEGQSKVLDPPADQQPKPAKPSTQPIDPLNPPAEFWDWTTKNNIPFTSTDPKSLTNAVRQWQQATGVTETKTDQGTVAAPTEPTHQVLNKNTLSGTSTIFGLNYDQSFDPQDNGRGFFGFNTRDPKTKVAAVPIDVLQGIFGTFTKRNSNGTYSALDTPEAKAIIAEIRSAHVELPDDQGKIHSFAIGDIQGSLAGHPGHVLDLSYGAVKEMGYTDNHKVSYQIIGGDGKPFAIPDIQVATTGDGGGKKGGGRGAGLGGLATGDESLMPVIPHAGSAPTEPQSIFHPDVSGGGGGIAGGGGQESPRQASIGGGLLDVLAGAAAGGAAGYAATRGQGGAPSTVAEEEDPLAAMTRALIQRGFTPQQAQAFAQSSQAITPGKGIGPLQPPAAPTAALQAPSGPPSAPQLPPPSIKVAPVKAPPPIVPKGGPDPTVVKALMKQGFTREQAEAVASKAVVSKPGQAAIAGAATFRPSAQAPAAPTAQPKPTAQPAPPTPQERRAQIAAHTEGAIAEKRPMHISYISAPREAERYPTRESRTMQYEEHSPEARLMGSTTGQLVGHSLIPVESRVTKEGEPYILGLSTNVMANNHRHINEKLATMGRQSPYPEFNQKFFHDVEGYLGNLNAGHTGTGQGYQSGTEEHPVTPDLTHTPHKLTRHEADFINLVLNNTKAMAQHKRDPDLAAQAQAVRELARVHGTLITEAGETNRMRHEINQQEPKWSTRVLEPSVRSFKTGLVHEVHPTEATLPETIRPGPEYQQMTAALHRAIQRGRPDIAIGASLHHNLQHNANINSIERAFSEGKITEQHAREALRGLGEDPDEYRYISGSGGLITPYEENPEAITPEEHTELKNNLRKQWIGGKLDVENYRRKAAEVPLPELASRKPTPAPSTEEEKAAPPIPTKPKPPRPPVEPMPSEEEEKPEGAPEAPAPAKPAVKMGDKVFAAGSHYEAWVKAGKPRGRAQRPHEPEGTGAYTYGFQEPGGAFTLGRLGPKKPPVTPPEAPEAPAKVKTPETEETGSKAPPAPSEEEHETLYRGNTGTREGGTFYSPDKEFARQFTQSGRDEEIRTKLIPKAHIHEPAEETFAGDPEAVDKAIAEAKGLGKRAVRLSEGQGQPNSVFVFKPGAPESTSPPARPEPPAAPGAGEVFTPSKPKKAAKPEATPEVVSKPKDWKKASEEERQAHLESKVADTLRNQYRGKETHPLEVQRDEKGGVQYDPQGNPVYVKHDYDIANSPLLKKKALGQIEGADEHEDTIHPDQHTHLNQVERRRLSAMRKASAVGTMGDKIVESYLGMKDIPEITAGKGWYSRMREKLADALGEHHELFAQLLGATSAKTPVRNNFIQSLDALEQFKNGAFDRHIEKYLEAYNKMQEGKGALNQHMKDLGIKLQDENGNPIDDHKTDSSALAQWIAHHDILPKQKSGQKYNANSMAVLKALAGTWLKEVGAPKTPNFAGNLSGRTLEATIDVWAARHLQRLGYEGLTKGKAWRAQAAAEPGVNSLDFAFSQDAMRHAADKLSAAGHPMNPDDLQAILWFAEKHHYADKGWTRGAGAEKSSFDDVADKVFPKTGAGMTSEELRAHYAAEAAAAQKLKAKVKTAQDIAANRPHKLEAYMTKHGLTHQQVHGVGAEPEEEEAA